MKELSHLLAFSIGALATAGIGWLFVRKAFASKHQRDAAEAALAKRERDAEAARADAEAARALAEAQQRDAEAQQREADNLTGRHRRLAEAYRRRLQNLARLTPEEAREDLRAEVLQSCEDEVRDIRREILGRTEEELRREARRILVDVMQRMALQPEREACATIVPLPSEDMKGRIIGREGRNIRSFETTTGVTLLIDDTPGCILLSSFDPVRRETARLALERLIKDGRIHPAAIEQVVDEISEEMKANVMSIGEDALTRLRLTGVSP